MRDQEISVTPTSTPKQCPPLVRQLIDALNKLPTSAELKKELGEREATELPFVARQMRVVVNQWIDLRRTLHRLAQLAALPADMHFDYMVASIGSEEEWDSFCRRLPAPLWRDSTEANVPVDWEWPCFSITLEFSDDGRVCAPEHNMLIAFIGIEAKRLRECRVCWQIFWASRIEKSGGPYGCSPRCNNTLRQRAYKERK